MLSLVFGGEELGNAVDRRGCGTLLRLGRRHLMRDAVNDDVSVLNALVDGVPTASIATTSKEIMMKAVDESKAVKG